VCTARAVTTVGSGARSSAPATSACTAWRDGGDSPRAGSTTAAATVRTLNRAPSSTTSRTTASSPPSGPKAVATRCTVAGPVRRTAS
jgi:hypothetical protein